MIILMETLTLYQVSQWGRGGGDEGGDSIELVLSISPVRHWDLY